MLSDGKGQEAIAAEQSDIFGTKPTGEAGEESGQQFAAKVDDRESTESSKSDSGNKFSKSIEARIKDREKLLKGQGYEFTVRPKDARDFVANDGRGRNETIAGKQLTEIFGKRIARIGTEGSFGINSGIVAPWVISHILSPLILS